MGLVTVQGTKYERIGLILASQFGQKFLLDSIVNRFPMLFFYFDFETGAKINYTDYNTHQMNNSSSC